MFKRSYVLLPETEEIIQKLGERIKLARLRRDLSAEWIASKAGISRTTLWKIENGSPSVTLGMYAAVLHTFDSMDMDLMDVAKDDCPGRKLMDRKLKIRKRARRSPNKALLARDQQMYANRLKALNLSGADDRL